MVTIFVLKKCICMESIYSYQAIIFDETFIQGFTTNY